MPPKPIIPQNPTPVPQIDTDESFTPPPDTQEPSMVTTKPDKFGLYHVYTYIVSKFQSRG